MPFDYSSLVDKKWLDIPYKLNGRGFDGCDCVGLLWLWFKEKGIEIPNSDGLPYSCDWYKKDNRRYISALLKLGTWVQFNNVQPDDILLLLNHDENVSKNKQFVDSTAIVITPACCLQMTLDGSKVLQFKSFHRFHNAGAIRVNGKKKV